MGINKRVMVAYGGLPVIAVVVAIVMFAKGSTLGGMGSVFVMALLVLGITIFHTSIRPRPGLKKVDAWLDRKPSLRARTGEVSDVQREFDQMMKSNDDAVKKLEDVVKEDAESGSFITRFVDYIKTFSPKEKRKQIQAAQAQAVEEIKKKVLESGEGVFLHMETSKDRLSDAINDLHKEVQAAVALGHDPTQGSQARKRELESLVKKLERDKKKYDDLLKGPDSATKKDRLGMLETKLIDAMSDDPEKNLDQKLFKEVGEAESQLRYLETLRGRIQNTVQKVQDTIKPDWRDKRYEDMQALLDKIDKAIENLVPAAREHHNTAMSAFKRVKGFHFAIMGARQSELTELRIRHAAEAEDHRVKAEEAEKRIADLEKRLKASEDENARLKERVEGLEKNLGDANKLLKKWQDDLKEAHAFAKTKDKHLDSWVVDILVKNINEQESTITRMIKVLVSKEELRASEESRANDAEQALVQARSRIRSLESEVADLTSAKSDLEAERSTLLDNKKTLEGQIQTLESDLKKLAPEIEADVREQMRKEHEENIREMQARIDDINKKLTETETESANLDSELTEARSKLAEANNIIPELETQVRDLTEGKASIKQSLDRTQKELETVRKEKQREIDELKDREDALEKELNKAKDTLSSNAKELRELQAEADTANELAEDNFEKLASALSDKGRLEKRMQETKKALDEVKASLQKEQTANKQLSAALEKKKEHLQKAFTAAKRWQADYKNEVEPAKIAAAENEVALNDTKRLLAKKVAEVKELKAQLAAAKKSLEESRELAEEAQDEDMQEFFRKLNTRIEELTEQVRRLDTEKSMIEAEKTAAEERAKKAETHERQLKTYSEELEAELKGTNAEIDQRLQEMTRKADALQSKVDELEGKLREKEVEEQRLSQSEEHLRNELTRATEELEQARRRGADATTLRKLVEEQAAKLGSLETSLEEREATIADISDTNSRLIEENVRLVQQHLDSYSAIEAKLAAMTTEANAAKDDVEALEKAKALIEEQVTELKQQIAALQPNAARVPGLVTQVEALQEQLGSREAELSTAAQELNQQLGRNRELEEQNAQFRQQLDSLQKQIEAAGKAREEHLKRKEREDRRNWFNENSLKFRQMAQKIQAMGYDDPTLPTKIAEAETEYEKILKDFVFSDPEKQTLEAFYDLVENKKADLQSTLQQQAVAATTRPAPATKPVKKGSQPRPAFRKPPKALVIGDVHGDFDRLVNLLKQAKVMDDGFNWTAHKDTQVVMVGDYIDRGEKSFKVLNLIYSLKRQAGKQLKLLIGNHEAMFLGAFDWPGFDKKTFGTNELLADYLAKKAEFDRKVEERRARSSGEQDKILKEMGPEFRSTYLRLVMLGFSWLQNDTQVDKELFKKLVDKGMEPRIAQIQASYSPTLRTLNITTDDLVKDPGAVTDASYYDPDLKKKTPVRNYLKFLRENLDVYHYMSDERILIVHAGIPYKVPNPEAMDMRMHGSFQGYIFGSDLMSMMNMIDQAIKNRNVQLWMAFSEQSPIFACNPADRSKEWDSIPQYKEEDIKSVFGFNAVIFGHSRGTPKEDNKVKKYEGKQRRNYNIDFGMSHAYNNSIGGWLTVNADETITIHVLSDDNKIQKYDYEYKTEEEKKEENKSIEVNDANILEVSPNPLNAK